MDTDQTLQTPLEVAPKKRVKRVYNWQCAYCGENFDTENYSQRYCNPTHKKYAQRLRNAAREPEALEG